MSLQESHPHPYPDSFQRLVLLVEDNPADRHLFHLECSHNYPMRVIDASDGRAALRMIDESSFAFVVLDLNLPDTHGLEVLRQIRLSKNNCDVPVMIFSSSTSDRDVLDAYSSGASCYVVKPTDLDAYGKACRLSLDFWLCTVVLPPPPCLADDRPV